MNAKTEFMMIFSGNEWYNQISPAEAKKISDQTKAWFESLAQRGCVKGGHGLVRSGVRITAKTGRVVSDGPYPESKEAVGGYMIVEAENLEEAIEIAKGNPTIAHGMTVDIRQAFQGEENCPLHQRALEAEQNLAAAV
jgi:hypothetical protein